MARLRGFALSYVVVVACGGRGGAVAPDGAPDAADGKPEVPDAAPDAPDGKAETPDAAPDAMPTVATVTLQTVAEPVLVAFRDESSTTWQVLSVAGTTTFEIHPTGPYRLVVVCRTPRSVNATQYGLVLEDGTMFEHACGAPTRPLTARGSLAESGLVSFGGNQALSSAAPWTFELAVSPGTYDLVTLLGDPFDPDRIALRRDVAMTADLDLGAVDLTGAEPLAVVSFTPTNKLDGEIVTHYTYFDSGQGAFYSFVQSGSWAAKFVPASLLRTTDHQGIELGAYTLDGPRRSIYRGIGRAYHAGDPTEVTLPAAIAPVSFEVAGNRLSVALPAMPSDADAELATQTQVKGDDAFRVQSTRLSSQFMHATGTTSVVVDFTHVPGFLAEWMLADTGLRIRSFDASVQTSPYDRTLTGVSETLGSVNGVVETLPRSPLASLRRSARPRPVTP